MCSLYEHWKFPSPYGVSFILILKSKVILMIYVSIIVSVSLRSIIHSYAFKTILLLFIKFSIVSVSLRSIIHSYQDVGYIAIEYKYIFRFPSPYGVSFILMRLESSYGIIARFKTFPSPYGVSFILIHFYLIS